MSAVLEPEPTVRAAHRRTPGEVGIWVFIMGDLFIFGLFFGVFIWDRADNTALFDASRAELNISWGAVNTLLLLTGSLFVVWAVNAAREGLREQAAALLGWTMACGAIFMVNKFLEYSDKITSDHGPDSNMFFTYYFCFTGLHALHLAIALCFLARLRWLLKQPDFGGWDLRTLETGGLYWHLVDLLWIVLFALLYLTI